MTNQSKAKRATKTEKTASRGSESAPNQLLRFIQDQRLLTVSVSLQQSRFDTPTPTLALNTHQHTPHRTLRACTHYLAMLTELATSPTDRWTIEIDILGDSAARLVIETLSGTAAEANRALAVLEDVRNVVLSRLRPSA